MGVLERPRFQNKDGCLSNRGGDLAVPKYHIMKRSRDLSWKNILIETGALNLGRGAPDHQGGIERGGETDAGVRESRRESRDRRVLA